VILANRLRAPTRRKLVLAGWSALVLVAAAAAAAPADAVRGRERKAVPQAMSIVAQARAPRVAVYRSPHAKRPFRWLTNPNPDGSPLVFLVTARAAGWEKVLLPVRPNESTGWIRDRAVALALNPYRVQVSLGQHRVRVWNGRRKIVDTPAGVGRSVVPTPRGIYFITELLKQPYPGGAYGPYAFGLSAFSNVYFSFGGGPGAIGLHGTNDPGALGTDVSHGCIRIRNEVIEKLAHLLPLGTPVKITA
jgi:lipoprotein-anchoring transpeptidase ErfK/SrfK